MMRRWSSWWVRAIPCIIMLVVLLFFFFALAFSVDLSDLDAAVLLSQNSNDDDVDDADHNRTTDGRGWMTRKRVFGLVPPWAAVQLSALDTNASSSSSSSKKAAALDDLSKKSLGQSFIPNSAATTSSPSLSQPPELDNKIILTTTSKPTFFPRGNSNSDVTTTSSSTALKNQKISELNITTLVLLARVGSGQGIVCSMGPNLPYVDGSLPYVTARKRYLIEVKKLQWENARRMCNLHSSKDELLGQLVWSHRLVEYYPGEKSMNENGTHPVGIISFGNLQYIQSVFNVPFMASKLAWAEASGTPWWLYVADIESSVASCAERQMFREQDLGVWWRDYKNEMTKRLELNFNWVQAWQKPMILLETMLKGKFEWLVYLDVDAWVPRLSVPVSVFIPQRMNNTARNVSRAGLLDQVHLVAPLKKTIGRLRWSNWFFALKTSSWSVNFTRKWLAHSDCDCWADQGAMWIVLMQEIALWHNKTEQYHWCDQLWSGKSRGQTELWLRSAFPKCVNSMYSPECIQLAKDMATKMGPMLCACRKFNCFDAAVYRIASDLNLTSSERVQAKSETVAKGLIVPPVWWWRETLGVRSGEYFDVLLHHR